jgi:hypothetical protein
VTELPAAPRSRLLRPAVALPVLAGIVILAALLTPEPVDTGRGDVSTYSRSESGAQLAYELARRLGWRVGRRLAPLDTTTEPDIVNVVLGAREPIGAHEAHHLLESVRRGGALIASVDEGSALADSLRVTLSGLGRFVSPDSSNECDATHERRTGLFATPPVVTGIAWNRPAPPGLVTFGSVVTRPAGLLPAAVGFSFGRGRIALVSDAELFTNDVVRVCRWRADIVVVRLYEFVRPRGDSTMRTALIFDEYHHGYGTHPGSLRAIGGYLARTASGHMVVQLSIAGLVLLLAIAPRPIVPRDPERTARRSPLEHADALAHAYAEVGATRTVVGRLVSGVRRRAGRGVAAAADNESFLHAVAALRPALRDDVARVQQALRDASASRDLAPVGTALQRIEQFLTPTGGR